MESRQRNRILTLLFFGVLMGALDIAILGPALPAIRSTFAVSERTLTWMFSAYVLFQLVSTPLMAKFSDLYGRRWIYTLDIALFGLGSVLVALAQDFNLILLGRAIQGFGAGGIFPVASAVIGDTFPPEKRGGALGMIGAVFGLAFLVGPVLGGVILAVATWRWLFLINVPVALLLILFSLRLLPNTRAAHTSRLDVPGMALLALALAAMTLGLNRLDPTHFLSSLLSPTVGGLLLVALLLLAALVQVERRAATPLLPGYLFRRRQLVLAYLLSAGAGFAEASLVFVPLMAVTGLAGQGISEKNASWLLLPAVLAMAVGAPLSGRLLDRIGSKRVILAGTLVMSAGFWVLGGWGAHLAFFLLAGVLIGLGLSALLGAPIRYIMLGEAAAGERSLAQGVVTLFSSVGQLSGSALMGAMVASFGRESPMAGYRAAFIGVALGSIILFGMANLLKSREQELETLHAQKAFGND